MKAICIQEACECTLCECTQRVRLHSCPQGHIYTLRIARAHKYFVSSVPPPMCQKKKTQLAAALQKYCLSLSSDREILETCLSKLLCCEMTSTSPMEQKLIWQQIYLGIFQPLMPLCWIGSEIDGCRHFWLVCEFVEKCVHVLEDKGLNLNDNKHSSLIMQNMQPPHHVVVSLSPPKAASWESVTARHMGS